MKYNNHIREKEIVSPYGFCEKESRRKSVMFSSMNEFSTFNNYCWLKRSIYIPLRHPLKLLVFQLEVK